MLTSVRVPTIVISGPCVPIITVVTAVSARMGFPETGFLVKVRSFVSVTFLSFTSPEKKTITMFCSFTDQAFI